MEDLRKINLQNKNKDDLFQIDQYGIEEAKQMQIISPSAIYVRAHI